MEAKVFLTGKLGSNAEVTPLEGGRAVIKFSVACNAVYTNKKGEQVKATTWHDCKKFMAFPAESLAMHLQKGKHVTVTGLLRYDEYEQPIPAANPVRHKRAYVEIRDLVFS